MTPLPLNALPPPALRLAFAHCRECGHDSFPARDRCAACGGAGGPPTAIKATGQVLLTTPTAAGDFVLFASDSGERLVAPLAGRQPRLAPGARGRLVLRRGASRPAGGEGDDGLYYVLKIVVAAALPARQENA
jgi:hypothetical protein